MMNYLNLGMQFVLANIYIWRVPLIKRKQRTESITEGLRYSWNDTVKLKNPLVDSVQGELPYTYILTYGEILISYLSIFPSESPRGHFAEGSTKMGQGLGG